MSGSRAAGDSEVGALTSRVPAVADGQRLVDWLTQRFRYHDAAGWQAELAAGRVWRNGQCAAADDLARVGDRLTYRPVTHCADALPPIEILCADADFAVVAKPAYSASHTAGAFPANTVVQRLAAQLCTRDPAQLRLAHRLDRETSGALLVACSAAASRAFEAQFAAATIDKEYLALVAGVVGSDALTLAAPIGRATASAVGVRRAVVGADTRGAQPAVTDVRVVERCRDATLVAVQPRTGRTHQIRVHLASVGHPVLGDKLYGRSDAEYFAYVDHVKRTGDPRWPGVGGALRHMLHAAMLEFAHPRTGARLRVQAPLPADFADCLARRRR